jgi:hypothetical protein
MRKRTTDTDPIRLNVIISGQDIKPYRALKGILAKEHTTTSQWIRKSILAKVNGK